MEVAVEAQRASLSQPAPPYTSSSQTHASAEPEPQAESPDRHQDQQSHDQPLQNGVMPTVADVPPSSATHSSATETESSAPDRPAVETLAPVSSETTEQSVNTQVVEVIETPSTDVPVVNGEPDTMETDTAVNGGQAPVDGQIQPQNENTPVNGTTEQQDQSQPRENEEPSEDSSPSTASDGSTDSSESTERTGEDYDEDENDEPAYWAEYKEDTSVAEGDELKEIESGDADHSAHECKPHSKLLLGSAAT